MPIAPAPPSAPIVAAGASRRHYPRRSPAAATRWSGPLRALGLLGLLGIVASTFLTAAGAAGEPSQYVPARSGGWIGWLAGPLQGLGLSLGSGGFQTLTLI